MTQTPGLREGSPAVSSGPEQEDRSGEAPSTPAVLPRFSRLLDTSWALSPGTRGLVRLVCYPRRQCHTEFLLGWLKKSLPVSWETGLGWEDPPSQACPQQSLSPQSTCTHTPLPARYPPHPLRVHADPICPHTMRGQGLQNCWVEGHQRPGRRPHPQTCPQTPTQGPPGAPAG